jgi:phosphoribosyl 1,2-cyclic phosphate phosphodiesterase
MLIDASPDLRRQLLKERITEIDRIFLTHWHYDHFGGLGELEYYVRLQRGEPLGFAVPPSAESQFAAAFPYLDDCLSCVPWEFGTTYHFGDVGITPLEANHGEETAGFLIESEIRRLAYFPDTAGLPGTTKRAVAGVDWLVCDATFHGDNWFPDQHMSVDQAIALGTEIGARHTVLTHLALHYSQPITDEDLRGKIARYPQVSIAYDGMRFSL